MDLPNRGHLSPSQFRLLDLSDAVLAQLCRHLFDRDLLSASLLCRRLNEIALGTYFARNDIIQPGVKCEVVVDWEDTNGNSFNLLHALIIATYLRATEHLSLIFLNGDLSQLSRNLTCCCRLVERLSPLRKVSLEFGNTRGVKLAADEKAQKQWNSSFINLWMAVLKNGSVTSFTIRATWDFLQNYMRYADLHSTQQPRRPIAALRQLRNNINFVLATRRAVSELPLGKSTLTSLHIETPLLFLPEFYHLTVATLRCSPITSLALYSLPSGTQCAHMFDEIVATLPDLAELTMIGVQTQPKVLTRFLSRLPRLAGLTLERFPTYPSVWAEASDVPRFAHLRKLSLQWRDLAVFSQQPAFLSQLESLDVSIALIHLLECELLDTLSPTCQHPHINLSIHLHLFEGLAPASLINAFERCIDFALAMGPRWSDVFSHVRYLTLGDAGGDFGASCEFARWLRLFPAETITWDDGSPVAIPSLLSRHLVREALRHQSRSAAVVEFIPPSTTTAATFLGLPDDILLALFEYLSDELFDLSLLSRRLNFLALPVYLDRAGVVDRSTGKCTVLVGAYPQPRDALAALSIALFVFDVKSLYCDISRAPHVYPSLDQLRRLISFVERLTSVEEASLCFGASDSTPRPAPYDPLQYQWCMLFEQLLNTVVAKSRTSLSVTGSPYLFPSDMAWKQRILDSHNKNVVLTPPSHTSLKVFAFEPSSLLSPIFLPWATVAIQHSTQLSRIDILMNSNQDQFYLDILAKTIPSLRELKISIQYRVQTHILVRLLVQLPALESLHIQLNSNAPVQHYDALPTSASGPRLPRLKSLRAPGAYLNTLTRNNPLPALEALQIDVVVRKDEHSAHEVPSIFALLAHREYPFPAVTLSVQFIPTPEVASPFRTFDKMLGAEVEWEAWVPRITALELTATGPENIARTIGSYLKIFRERLGRFTKVVNVAFDYASAVQDGSEEAEAEKARLTVQAIEIGSPQIQRICINGKQWKGF
ncbi:hypothetical protein C8R43DRAFT_1000976 [Mycena crocata]|nr:hypothetical protein C8R43DRAFT_1000976 [Mycena crocata]